MGFRRGGEVGWWDFLGISVKCGEKRGWLVGLLLCLVKEYRFLVKRSYSVVYNYIEYRINFKQPYVYRVLYTCRL